MPSPSIADDPRILVRCPGPPDPDAAAVVYWMQRAQRASDNPALDVAIAAGNLLRKPVVVLFVLPDVVPVELPVPPVPPVVVAVAAGVGEAAAVAVPVAVVLELVLDELLEGPLELLLEPAVLLELALPPVLVMKPVEPQPHISVLARKRYVWGPLAVSSVRERPNE